MKKPSGIWNGLRSLLAASALAITCSAHSAIIVANLGDYTNGGGFFGEVTLEDGAPGTGTIMVTVDISDPINAGIQQGDVLGIWFDVNNVSILSGLSASFSQVNFGGVFQNVDPAGVITLARASADTVNNLTTKPNGNGGISLGGNSDGLNFDIGIAVGTAGSAGGFNQTITFDWVYAGLSTSLFSDQRIGMRVQSIEGGSFEGSSRLLGTGTTPPPPPTPPSAVPEPGSLALLGVGLLGWGWSTRRQSSLKRGALVA